MEILDINSKESHEELLETRVDSARLEVDEAQAKVNSPIGGDERSLWEARLQSRKEILSRAENDLAAYRDGLQSQEDVAA